MRARSNIPAVMPRLSSGAHRSPRRGACFMEFVSYLAGERWSDHPECTDPVLASLARGVNDNLSDARRDGIVHEIPRVIGLRGDDSVVGLVVALRAAIAALPVASMERQRSLAIGILALRPALAERGAAVPHLDRLADRALADVPDAAAWAKKYLAAQTSRARDLHHTAAEAITRISASGIAAACIDDPDSLLIAMLRNAICDVEQVLANRDAVPSDASSFVAV
ncbi:MAG: hypothetical protein ABIQ01_08100 [Pseudolysinimonas sp.]